MIVQSVLLGLLAVNPSLAVPMLAFQPEQLALIAQLSGAAVPETKPGWLDPRVNGGQCLDFTTPDLGEPLNVIISGHSDPYILTDSGFHEYAKSIGFSGECLGLHYGDLHDADLGDGKGRQTEQFLARQHYFPVWGTCWESLAGGHHFRAWKQDGPLADTNAWFLGASKEKDSRKNHMIVDNGWNIGRDYIVEKATSLTSWKGKVWQAEVEWRADLLEPGKEGINHEIEQDGRVAVLKVHRVLSA